MEYALYWLIAMVILVVIECLSMGLTTIWFAGGALVAAIAAAKRELGSGWAGSF